MKVQTSSKSEPKFPKEDDSKLFYFLSHKREKTGSNLLKIWTKRKAKTAQKQSKNRAVKKREGYDEKLSDLKPSILFLFSANNNLCAACFFP